MINYLHYRTIITIQDESKQFFSFFIWSNMEIAPGIFPLHTFKNTLISLKTTTRLPDKKSPCWGSHARTYKPSVEDDGRFWLK